MNIDAKFSTKYLQIESHDVQKELYNMDKWDLLQVYKTDRTFENSITSWAQRLKPVIPAIRVTEAGESLEPWRQRWK